MPDFNPSAKNISASHQSHDTKISTFFAVIDFLEVQAAYTIVKLTGLLVADVRAVGL